jgi:hypothetical protein
MITTYSNKYKAIHLEFLQEQDKYDTQLYDDKTRQGFWQMRIAAELEALKEFENKEIVLYSKQSLNVKH